MTIEELESYRAVRTELEDIEEELSRQGVQIAVQSAADAPAYSKHTITSEGLPSTPEVLRLLKRKAEKKAKKQEIEKFVDDIEDSDIRLIVLHKYIRGRRAPSWQYIAMKLGYCAHHTPKRKLKKFLSDVQNVQNGML